MKQEDLALVRQWQLDFPIPDLSLSIVNGVMVDEEDNIVAIGVMRPLMELILLADKGVSKKDKVKSIVELLETADFVATTRGFGQVHCFVENNESYVNILKKHFGFKDVNGVPLVKEV